MKLFLLIGCILYINLYALSANWVNNVDSLYISDLKFDSKNKRLLVGSYNGLFIIEKNKKIIDINGPEYIVRNNKIEILKKGVLLSRYITCIAMDDTYYYIGTNKGLTILFAKDLTLYENISTSDQINSILELGDRLFIATYKGIFYLKDNILISMGSIRPEFSTFSYQPVSKIKYDGFNKCLWIIKVNDGVLRIKNKKIDNFLEGKFVYDVFFNKNKTIFSLPGSILIFNGISWKSISSYPSGILPSKHVYDILYLKNKVLLATDRGLFLYNGAVFDGIELEGLPKNLAITCMIKVKSKIYIGTKKYGLYYIWEKDL